MTMKPETKARRDLERAAKLGRLAAVEQTHQARLNRFLNAKPRKPTKQEDLAAERKERAEQAKYEARWRSANAAYHRKFPDRADLWEKVRNR